MSTARPVNSPPETASQQTESESHQSLLSKGTALEELLKQAQTQMQRKFEYITLPKPHTDKSRFVQFTFLHGAMAQIKQHLESKAMQEESATKCTALDDLESIKYQIHQSTTDYDFEGSAQDQTHEDTTHGHLFRCFVSSHCETHKSMAMPATEIFRCCLGPKGLEYVGAWREGGL